MAGPFFLAQEADVLDQIDGWLQARTDAAMGLLESHGVHVPTVLREMTVVSFLSSLFLVIVALNIPEAWFIAYLLVGVLATTGYWAARRWLAFNADARREWSGALAEKYSKRGLRLRMQLRGHRIINIVVAPFLASLLIHATMLGAFPLALLALGIRALVMIVQAYVDGSIPLPPPRRAPVQAVFSGA